MQAVKMPSHKRRMQIILVAITCVTVIYIVTRRRGYALAVSFHVKSLGGQQQTGKKAAALDGLSAASTRFLDREQGFLLVQALVRHGMLDFGPVSRVELDERREAWDLGLDQGTLSGDNERGGGGEKNGASSVIGEGGKNLDDEERRASLGIQKGTRVAEKNGVSLDLDEGNSSGDAKEGVFSDVKTGTTESEEKGVPVDIRERGKERSTNGERRDKKTRDAEEQETEMEKTETKKIDSDQGRGKSKKDTTEDDEDFSDLSFVASADLSLLHAVDPIASGNPAPRSTSSLPRPPPPIAVSVGDHVTVRVDLRDGAGRAVLRGGAEVRMWAVHRPDLAFRSRRQQQQHNQRNDVVDKNQPGQNQNRRRQTATSEEDEKGNDSSGPRWKAVGADVTDMRNGSFLASLPVLWSGEVEVRAALVRPREFRAVVLRLMDTMKMINQVVATFSSKVTRAQQVTLCSFLPVIPGYAGDDVICNLTSRNGGLPWYCGRPVKAGLTCDDWAWSTNTDFPPVYPLPPGQQLVLNRYSLQNRVLPVLNNTIMFFAKETDSPQPSRRRFCGKASPRDTWTDQSPRGFWDGDRWRPLSCDLPPLTPSLVTRCLSNTTVLFLGDSNAEQILQVLNKTMKCSRAPENDQGHDLSMTSAYDLDLEPGRHVPAHFRCPQGLRLSWFPHAYPFYSGAHAWTPARAKHAPSDIMDRIPGAGSYVVLIHLYMHFSPVHSSVYALHVRDTARAVSRLLRRNPGVRVVVRGPHAVFGDGFCLAGDYHAERCLRILTREFRGLRDHVTLLNPWDMTVANENYDIHPNANTVRAITQMMITAACQT